MFRNFRNTLDGFFSPSNDTNGHTSKNGQGQNHSGEQGQPVAHNEGTEKVLL